MLMFDHYYAVIMAGGGGTRLWPLSRQARPKQMLELAGERSLFQAAVQRLDGLFTPDRIYVVTVEDQAQALQEQAPEIPPENYLLEPMPRGTASVVGFAAVAIQNRDPQGTMAVVTADHVIGNEGKFRQLLRSAYEAAQDGYLVTLGISPSFAATGYGYIQQGSGIDAYQGLQVFQTLRFREKPSETRAQEMLASGDHTWNSGMFIWRIDRIMAEIARQMPDLNTKLAEISQAWDQPQGPEVISRVWPTIQPQTIDYGIMENATNVAVIPAQGLDWSDVGAWDALFDVLPADTDGNILMRGTHLKVDTQNTLVYVKQDDRLIVTIGVEDLVVIDTGDVVMICPKDQAQKVRQAVDQLKQNQDSRYL
jgi:mannose-1-phosphate guanylyltransferase